MSFLHILPGLVLLLLGTPTIFPIAFWMGLCSTQAEAEVWIRLTRPCGAAIVP